MSLSNVQQQSDLILYSFFFTWLFSFSVHNHFSFPVQLSTSLAYDWGFGLKIIQEQICVKKMKIYFHVCLPSSDKWNRPYAMLRKYLEFAPRILQVPHAGLAALGENMALVTNVFSRAISTRCQSKWSRLVWRLVDWNGSACCLTFQSMKEV